MLIKLGAEMGFDLWPARNDRCRQFDGKTLGELDGVIDELPTQFIDATNKTIEIIDVLWLRGKSIVAAFEIEWTTSVYSGLLRMSDLLALQPNLNIKLYLVAPDERRDKVEQETLGPTFTLREKPLRKNAASWRSRNWLKRSRTPKAQARVVAEAVLPRRDRRVLQ